MATVWVECWKCDVCGHRWIKGEVWPDQCRNTKCRSRKWNAASVAAVSKDYSSEPVVSVEQPEPVGEVLPPDRKPSLADLRALVASKMAEPVAPVVAQASVALCGYEEEDRATGEWGRCRRLLGHKGVCGLWEVFSKTG